MGFIRGFCPLAGRGIANREGDSIVLLSGSDTYKKQGGKFVKQDRSAWTTNVEASS
jgi:hypothetical protein